MNRLTRFALSAALALGAIASHAQPTIDIEAKAVEARLRSLYPATRITTVRNAGIDGLYEVTMGKNVAYTDATGRYFIFGNLLDMTTQTDLTAQRQDASQASPTAQFPADALKNAIKTVRGNGKRAVAVFSDPDCPWCRNLEPELARLKDVTIYTFLMPFEQLHPGATTKAISVWCAADPKSAWDRVMRGEPGLPLKACDNPIKDNQALGARMGINGTPTLIADDGRVFVGAAPVERLQSWLDSGSKGPN